MNYINEKLETPIKGEYDVIVVGAGPAGCGAALACAKSGLKTIIVDKFNCLGGAWTTGFMNPLFDEKNKTGMMREIVDELNCKSAWGGFWDISFNYEYMKVLLENRMKEAGAEFLFNTYFSKAICDGDRVTGVILENVEGRFALMGKYIFDCTGDGHVAASAGCEFELGEDGDYRTCQAMTLMFLVGNIPEKYKLGMLFYDKLNAVYEKGGKQIPFKMPYLIPVPNSHFGVVQFTHMYEYDPLSARDITDATVEGRRQMMEAFELLKKYDEEFKDLDLIGSSNVLGIRESRRIVGEYRLCEDDLVEGRKFDDGLCTVSFNVDIHPKDNQAQKCQKVTPYEIPLRCLIPKGKYGIMTAGRCISGSHVAHASYRVTGNCFSMGEGAGYAVAKAIKENIDIREVKIK